MSDDRPANEEPAVNQPSGINVHGENVQIHGDLVARDKIMQHIVNNIDQLTVRLHTAAEEARRDREIEAAYLNECVVTYMRDLQKGVYSQQTGSSPYKGLLIYSLNDAAIFYGRDIAVSDVLDHLGRGRLTILHAESGAGKTSLLQAGVAPQLIAAQHLPLYVRPYNVEPSLAIKRLFISQAESDLSRTLFNKSLRDFLRQVSSVLGSQSTLCIFLDQFEEFFTQLSDLEYRMAFITQLADCLEDPGLNVRWILSLRADFFSNLAYFRPRISNPFENDYQLRRLTRAEARQAIEEPAKQFSLRFEEGLVDTLLDDVIRGAGSAELPPPQLQLVCSALYDASDRTRTITHQVYQDAGGVAGILSGYLDRVLTRNVQPEFRQAARLLMEALVTSDGHRAVRTRDDLANDLAVQGVSRSIVDVLLEQMLASRLLRIEDQIAASYYELVHDYLLEEIKIDPIEQGRKAAQELIAQEMETHQRHPAILVSADRLAIIEAQADRLNPSADSLDLLFRSAFKQNRGLAAWRECAARSSQLKELISLWVKNLDDAATAETAAPLLVSLSHVEVVEQLKEFIQQRAPVGHLLSLREFTVEQWRAITVLAQIQLPEAEAYLRTLTPERFCLVPAGSFIMGRDDKSNGQRVTLNAFWIAMAPVIVSEWRRFMEAGAYLDAHYWLVSNRGRLMGRLAPAGWKDQQNKSDHPVHYLTLHEAIAYARWMAESTGLPIDLPAEAEWEKAAGWDATHDQMRLYPWGDDPDAARCNVSHETGPNATTPVGQFSPQGDSPCGAQDMAGNVLEWTQTIYRSNLAGDESVDQAAEELMVLRGGAFNLPIDDARCAHQHVLDAGLGLGNTGCRICIRPVPLPVNQESGTLATALRPG